MDTACLDLGFGTVPARSSAHIGAFFRTLEERDAILKEDVRERQDQSPD